MTLPLLMTRNSICPCRPGGGVYSVDTLLTHTGWSCLGLHCFCDMLDRPKLVYEFSIFPGAMIPVHLSLNVI